MKNNKFDTRVNIEVKILPIRVPNNTGEELAWEKINHSVQHQARILAHSLEEYFEQMAESEFKYRVNTKELGDTSTH